MEKDGKCVASYQGCMDECKGERGNFAWTCEKQACGAAGLAAPAASAGTVSGLTNPGQCGSTSYGHGQCANGVDLCKDFDHTTCVDTDPCCCDLCD